MKILVLTQELGTNIGGILQNWALQTVLKDLGQNPVTLRKRPIPWLRQTKYLITEYALYYLKHILRHPTRNIEIRSNKLKMRFSELDRFVKKHIVTTPPIYKIDSEFLVKKRYDMCIVGSDQVWRPKYNINTLEEMFCTFLPDSSGIKCSAYAASFGVDNWEMNEQESAMAKNAIKKFSTVSVREESGVDLCRRYLDTKAVHVLDPTFLIEKERYKTLIRAEDYAILPQKPYAANYTLDAAPGQRDIIEEFCHKKGLIPFHLSAFDIDSSGKPNVERWIAGLMNAAFIITDSFHGTAFALNFEVPFISIYNAYRGTARFKSLANQFDCHERFIDNARLSSLLTGTTANNLDWDNIRQNKRSMKEFSMSVIKSILS